MTKSQRPEIAYLIQNILPLLRADFGFPTPEDEERVKIDEIPVRIGSGIKKPDTVYYWNGTAVFLIEAAREGEALEQKRDQALSYIRNFPVQKYSQDGIRPRFFAVTVGKRIFFFEHRFEIEGSNLKDWVEPLKEPIHFSDLLTKYGLSPAVEKEVLTAESFRTELLNELTAIYKLSDRITPEVVLKVSEQSLSFLEHSRDFTSHRPYLDLEKHKDRQAQIRQLYERVDWNRSVGEGAADAFRDYIHRAFQGTNLNQYLTERCVIVFMINLVGKIGPTTRVLDFECGSGGFLVMAAKCGAMPENIFGVEIDKLPYTIAKTYLALYFKKTGVDIGLLPIRHDNGLFYWGKDWDVVMGNPAGGNRYEHDNLEKIGEHLDRDLDRNGVLDDNLSEYNLSIQQAVVSVKVGGKICLVLPEGFFSNSQDDFLRKFVAKHCQILAIVSLPRGVFKKGVSTRRQGGGAQVASMKMSILLAEKIRDVDTEDPVGGNDFPRLAYPVFMASVAEPESKSGSVCDWLEPSLLAILEQWQSWRETKQIQSALTIKIRALDNEKKKKLPLAPVLPFEREQKQESKRPQPKAETKVSADLDEVL
jgi:SAM-dependent methyltransferase